MMEITITIDKKNTNINIKIINNKAKSEKCLIVYNATLVSTLQRRFQARDKKKLRA